MKRRKTIQGGVEGFAESHARQIASSDSAPEDVIAQSEGEDILREHIVRKIFSMCQTVVRSIQQPANIEFFGLFDLAGRFSIYASEPRDRNRQFYGRVLYVKDEQRPKHEKQYIFRPIDYGDMHQSLTDAVEKTSELYTPAGLLAFDYIMCTNTFKNFPIGVYIFPGAFILNSMGEWCVLEVHIGERHGLSPAKIVEPYLVPLNSPVHTDRRVVLIQKTT